MFEGNQNNYLSFHQCQQACGARNPCAYGEPLMQNDVRQRCSPSNLGSCPANHYCHVSEGCLDTAVCCPIKTLPDSTPIVNPLITMEKQSARCTMEADVGNGIGMMQRWAYNTVKKTCELFVYSGSGGNANNFVSLAECVQACGVGENPCGSGFPLMDDNGYVRCGSLKESRCPASHYCHIGSNEDTTVCCPLTGKHFYCVFYKALDFLSLLFHYLFAFVKSKFCRTASLKIYECDHLRINLGLDRCQLPLSTGSGTSVIHRYYFDPTSSICRSFTYTGIGGNENNFGSLTECRLACPEYDNPCPSGVPFVSNVDGSVAYCTAINPSCPTGYWCHVGETRQTSVCCPEYIRDSENRSPFGIRARRPMAAHPASVLSMLSPADKRASFVCSLPLMMGSGVAQLPRFFYNAEMRTCQPFAYTGKGGNQNNFISKTDCEETCPVLDNPCSSGFPATDANGEPVLCSTSTPKICGRGYYCHIGATATTTLCCPGVGDPCHMPMARGSGSAVLNRWYFNRESQVCVSFVYSGRGGNPNNFLSRQDCLKACPEYRSPCPQGHPHIGLSGQITHCGASGPSICPTTYWCHVGATLETSVCCPGAADPCEQKLQLGTGSARLHRFYYNQLTRTCQQFQYTGLRGNENNFLTLSACESRCPVFTNPCAYGQPQLDESLNAVICSAADDSVCDADYFCHIGDEEQTTVCCPGRAENMCMEPLVTGTGEAALNRFAYNALTRQCLPFVYTGIGGNQNNFLSKASCEASCPVLANPCSGGDPATGANGQYIMCSSTSSNVCPAGYWCHIGADVTASLCCPGADNPCTLPPATGTGRAHVGRWYFDVSARRCSRFTYTGFGGNQNNFQTLQECRTRCPEFQNPCSTGDPAQAPSGGIFFCSSDRPKCPPSYWCHIGSTADNSVCCPSFGDPCLVAMMPGTGSAKLTRWYFNQNTRQCLQFTYTGIGGNENNFESELACSMKCPVFHSPCPDTLASSFLSITKCSAQNPYSCPAGHWCHIGGTPETTVCCPGASDPCQLSVSQGVMSGMGPYTRWFYDRASKICKPFQYTGIGGNENNFLTKEDCSAKCPGNGGFFLEFSNPCYAGDPFRDLETGLTKYCDPSIPFSCPNNYYCHIGENAQTTVCCPGSTDPCNSPLAVGSGLSALPRWYFNSRRRKCQRFTYTGVGGNSNNFISQQQCSQTCSEVANPCSNGSPLTNIGGSVAYCSALNPNVCPPGYFCHVGSAQENTVCCPGSANPCQLPMDIGRGSSSLIRYHFNQMTRKCEQFFYSGEGGNANNFLTVDACRQKCPELSNPCQMGEPFHPIGGSTYYCSAATSCPPGYFCHIGEDIATTVCCPSTVLESLCEGPDCVRRSKASHKSYSPIKGRLCPQGEPMRTTNGMPVSCSIEESDPCPDNKYVCSAMANGDAFCCPDPSKLIFICLRLVESMCRNFCLQPRNMGDCRSSNTVDSRFGYNPLTDSCVQFKFTGCGGNLNNFNSLGECTNLCCSKGYNLLYLHDSAVESSERDDAESVNSTSAIRNDDELEQGLSIISNDTLLGMESDLIVDLVNATWRPLIRRYRTVRRGGFFDIMKFW
ncbi:unnamed protein product [Toxocara canis]|uniref:Kunitz/Bovine pancreatic trypsin inhibitor domain protein n=1 Tax=Toxocara canis TaxID=6265 RepID=A0A183UAM3_TOXCA|nr:unnamed protein product [Toxocara canis]